MKLHAQGQTHAGIIACTFDVKFTDLAERIDQAIGKQADLTGKLIRINRPAK